MDKDNSTTHSRKRERGDKKTQEFSSKKALPFILLSLLFGIFIFFAAMIQNTIGFENAYVAATNFLNPQVDKLSSDNGRTNVLIMGRAGGEHEGKDLTDTIIVASVSLDEPDITLISIPRDLWIPEIRAKVNSAFYWGNQKDSDGGIPFAESTIEKVMGVPIHYALIIDFSAFKELVDAVDGVEVDVDRSFTDDLYPIAGKENDLCDGDVTFACRYEVISFAEGKQAMDGETALKFVRSRHSEGDEGTDTARSARQQKIIGALKKKTMSPQVYLNPNRVLSIFGVMKNSVEADMDAASGAILARKMLDAGDNIEQHLIPENLFINPPISRAYDLQYVFIPRAGNGVWTEIKSWVEGILF